MGLAGRLSATLVVLLLPAIGYAQGVDVSIPGSPGGVSSFLPTGFSTSGIDMSGVRVTPVVKAGFKRIALNYSLDIVPTELLSPFFPLFNQFGSLLDTYPIDIKLHNANLAVGTVGLNVGIGSAHEVFGNVSANIPRSITLQTITGPGIGVSTHQGLSWEGSQFQWNQYELGGVYWVSPAVGVIGGVRWERTSVRASNPVPIPSYGVLQIPSSINTVQFPNYGADLRTLLAIPYLGARVAGSYYRGSFIVGAANASVLLPVTLNKGGPYAGIFLIPDVLFIGRSDLSEKASYDFSRPGVFLEGNFETDYNVTTGMKLTFWGEGSWLTIRGPGSVDLSGGSSFGVFGLTFPITRYSSSSSGTSTLSRYTYGFGLTGSLSF